MDARVKPGHDTVLGAAYSRKLPSPHLLAAPSLG
jgi:hypothetical protein